MKPSRKKSLFIKLMVGLCTLIVGNAYAQVNYVLNPSLEDLYQCPDGFGQVHYAKHWFTPINGDTPDLLSACAIDNPSIGVPKHFKVNGYQYGYQYPRTGDNYAHFITYYTNEMTTVKYNMREYIKTQLRAKLKTNKEYCVHFHVNLSNVSKYGIDEIGAYFSSNGTIPINFSDTGNVAILNPQIKSPSGIILSDTLNWLPIKGSFIANGDEEFLYFGNFRLDINTPLEVVNPNADFNYTSYYLDDVSVIESDLPAYAGEDVTIGIGDSVFIGRQPEIGLECVWTDLQGNVVGNAAGMWVQPTQPTTYIVTQDLCGNIKHDTVTVYAFSTGIAVEDNKNQPFIFPIISQGEVYVTVPQAAGNQQLHIMDNQGKVYFSHIFEANATLTPLSLSLAPGVYFAHFQSLTSNETFTQKIVIH